METVSEPIESTPEISPAPAGISPAPAGISPAPAEISSAPADIPLAPVEISSARAARVGAGADRRELALGRFALPALVYLGTRLVLLAVALVETGLRHRPLLQELANWDGRWYQALALSGYPTHVSHAQTTLGFLPLYPLSMRGLAHLFGSGTGTGVTVAGLVISGIGGLVATLLVQELASGWWGESTGRRAALLFCLFPGSVVFSMVYSEGLLLPLAAGCILALQRRRWVLAGLLAGLATAVEPDALPLVLVCAVSAGLELRRTGRPNRGTLRALLAPVLSLSGVVASAGFLGLDRNAAGQLPGPALRLGREDRSVRARAPGEQLLRELSFAHFDHPTINLNLVVGLVGALLLVAGIVLLLRRPRTVSIEALIWTAGIAFLALTSEFVPPNPRLLITAFPVVLVFARFVRGRWLLIANGALLVGTSYLTYYGHTLRP